MINLAALWQLTLWKLREFFREPEAIFWVFIFPMLLAIVLGIAFKNSAPQPIPIAVENGGPEAALLARTLDSLEALEVALLPADEARNDLRNGRVALVVVPGASNFVFRYDSTREESRLARLVTHDAIQRVEGRNDVAEIREIRSAEPGARYIDFLIPGLLGMNIMGTGIWGVGFGIVQTRAGRLLKRFVASPMPKSHYLLGQMLGRMAFLIFEVLAILLFGILVFGVPMRGSAGTIAVVAIVGALAFAGLGLLIASRAKTLEGVSGLMNFVMMPMWLLSGVFFAWSRFPEAIQPMIKLLPLTALNDALRAVMLDGTSLSGTAGWLAIMSVWGVACFVVALKIFRWN